MKKYTYFDHFAGTSKHGNTATRRRENYIKCLLEGVFVAGATARASTIF